jgi:glycosyltransferase involved in cell wall biosynthesis
VKQPLISVIMPVHNGEKYIKEAIDSIINQTYKNIELIIIDDCSTDQTADIINKINFNKIIYIKNTA